MWKRTTTHCSLAIVLVLAGLQGCGLSQGRGQETTNHPLAEAQQVRGGGVRSPEWPALSKRFRAEHPRCAACGTLKGIQVHHIVPFHTDPAQELNESNLISLCKGRCHLKIGHGGSYQFFNPQAREDAALARTYPARYAETVTAARAHRLKNEPGFEN